MGTTVREDFGGEVGGDWGWHNGRPTTSGITEPTLFPFSYWRSPHCPGLNFTCAQSKFIHFPAGFDQKCMQAAAAAWPEHLAIESWTHWLFNILASFVFMAAVLILPWSIRCTCLLTCLPTCWRRSDGFFHFARRVSLSHYFWQIYPLAIHDMVEMTWQKIKHHKFLHFLFNIILPHLFKNSFINSQVKFERLSSKPFLNFVELFFRKIKENLHKSPEQQIKVFQACL